MIPKISIILSCRCEADCIRSSITSILRQENVEGGFELIVADGMSDDGTRDILREIATNDSRLTVIDNPRKITSTGLNAALKIARGEIIVRMDGHTDYAVDYVQQCVRLLESTGADNVGGPWVARGQGYVGTAIAAAFQSRTAMGGALSRSQRYEGPVDSVYLGCWRRVTFQRFGLFDEELVRNQDDEHNLRITRQGGTIWQSPNVKSAYCPRRSLGELFRQHLQYGYWKVRVIQKHRIPGAVRHLLPAILVLSLLVLAFTSLLNFVGHVIAPDAFAKAAMAAGIQSLVLFLFILGGYASAVAAMSLHVASRTQWKLLPILPVVLCCYHFGYGLGFLKGIVDFGLLKRSARPTFKALTRRTSAKQI